MRTARIRRRVSLLAVAAACGLPVGVSRAQQVPQDLTILQLFELEWDRMERRVPDVFTAGYDGLWIPPPSMAATYKSPGYDPFNRFDLGQPPLSDQSFDRARTTYGTEATFRAMLDEMHRGSVHVYIDGIFNHNSGRTTSDAFLADGGFPHFWIPRESPARNKLPTDDWGDFNGGNAAGYLQSENPGGFNYDLTNGDLVALIDIAHQSNNQFIRQPVEENPLNIPAGAFRNLPDPANARFYPDTDLGGTTVNNPGTSRNPGSQSFTFYPFNAGDPMAGDAITENATGYLMRWARWMMTDVGIDGIRLDAFKHMPTWFGDTFLDAALHDSRTDFWGNQVTPLTFGENITGNFDMLSNYIRKDGFANRDSLDIQGAARLRDLLNAGGFGTWYDITSNADSGPLDAADDGFVNGSVGIAHVFSHDNGTVGDGGSQPPLPTARQQGLAMHAYMLMRPGRTIVYHNARGIVVNVGRFNPREGVPSALGFDPSGLGLDDAMINLMYARNQVAFGQYFELNPSDKADVIIFERAAGGMANSVTAASDRWDAGYTDHVVTTSYPEGTRLHEMTGNAANPAVDPGNDIPSVLTVGPGGQLNIRVPNNASSAGEHGLGYLVYAEALPTMAVTFPESTGTIAPDPTNLPTYYRRLTETPIVSTETFTIRAETTQTDPLDEDVDDNALFRFGAGTKDYNGNGGIDITPSASVIGGYEQFLTTNNPLFGGTPGGTGVYEQTIDASDLEEGFNYLSVIAFRHRPSGTTPIFREVRTPVYVDLVPPSASLVQDGELIEDDATPELRYVTDDRTVIVVYAFLNLEAGEDPLTMLTTANGAIRYDRWEWRKTFNEDLEPGANTVTMVVVEESGRTNVIDQTVYYQTFSACPADISGDGNLNNTDINAFVSAFLAMQPAADFNGDGNWNNTDINAFVSAFLAGCD